MARLRRRPVAAAPTTAPAATVRGTIPAADRLAPLAVALLAFAVHARTIRFGFAIWDDRTNVVDNPFLHPPSAANLWHIWTTSYADLYVPLVYTSWALEAAVSNGGAWMFHLVNVLLHALAAAAVCALLLRTGITRWGAMAGGALFAVHPIQVEAVAWITGRKDVLSGLMSVASLLVYVSWRMRGGWWRYGASFACFVLALSAKPAAVTLPLMAAAADALLLRADWRRSARALAPWFVLAAAWSVVTARSQTVEGNIPLWWRPFVAGDALLFYLRKVCLPVGLAPLYGRTPWDLAQSPAFWIGLPVVAALAAAAWRAGPRTRLATCLFAAALLPVLGFKQFRFQNNSTVADRYAYTAMLGVALGVAAVYDRVRQQPGSARRAADAIAAVILAAMAALSLAQQAVWSDNEQLARRMLESAPRSGMPRRMLAVVFLEQGRLDEMIAEHRKAVELQPDANNLVGLAFALLKKGESAGHAAGAPLLRESAEVYRRALAADATVAAAWDGLARTQMGLGDLKGAEESLRRAVDLNPYNATSIVNLGLSLAQQKRYDEAIPHLERGARMRPKPQTYAYWIETLTAAGRRDEARAVLDEASRMAPGAAPELQRARAGLENR